METLDVMALSTVKIALTRITIMNNKGKTDYEIEVLEGQKMSDVFHEIGLPSNVRGNRKVTIVVYSDEYDIEEMRIIKRVVTSELSEWGFLDMRYNHKINITFEMSPEFSLFIITE